MGCKKGSPTGYIAFCFEANLEEGTPCDDGNDATDGDKCDAAGACAGDFIPINCTVGEFNPTQSCADSETTDIGARG